ncbi:methyltransferase [Kaistia dalseonensis]|uniref:Chemotaxis protein methyltransferase WspC n=1 Tax=Kaistia dalseonensis TaxID=410840 RepID=A0ABU0H0M1_9HYPH|nr:CheR family methyltransferase [Kaistia dalseonensis]MCX5493298.1 methyltransferase [Kaistia dalseonensis]MDQ0435855.1 chemotaxis protein methyltransferase WspC [Kaistia dalseonensis]
MLSAIERLLKDEIGLDSRTVGPSIIRHAVRKRMAACDIAEIAAYRDLLKASRHEVQELINATIVPETWFFRDREAFAAMVRHARAERVPGRPISILSLPCSTGEEPYSIAMAMFDAGFAETDFTVDGIDVSTHNLVEAERAVYGRNSFRGADLDFRDRYFEAVEGGHTPVATVRGRVRFRAGNLFDPALLAGTAPYDVIFCRNLLIYFDRDTQAGALERLRALLAPNGLLFVGPAESGLPASHGFVSARLPMAFAFRKAEAIITQPLAAKPAATPPKAIGVAKASRPAGTRTVPIPRTAPPRPRPAPVVAQAPAPELPAASLAAIEASANAGRIAEARQAALAHLEAFGPSAEIFYLLGLAHEAADASDEAVQYYRKALYLAPNHAETLAQLALLLRRRGDIAGAKTLSSRLGRIGNGSPA